MQKLCIAIEKEQIIKMFEFFFVPYRLLWRDFPQFVVGTKFPTSLYDTSVSSDSPKFDLAKIYNAFKSKLSASAPTPIVRSWY